MIFSQEQAQRVYNVLLDCALVDADIVMTGSTYQLRFCPADQNLEIDATAPAIELILTDPLTGAVVAKGASIRTRERYRKLKEFAVAYGLRALPTLKEILEK